MIQSIKRSSIVTYIATCSATLTFISSGMHYGWSSPSLPALENSSMTISHDDGSWLASMPLISSPIGALLAAVIVDIMGRKLSIIIPCFPFFVSWIMIAFAQSLTVLYIGRFITGIVHGWVYTIVPMYIGEIAEPKVRGLLGSAVAIAQIFGILLINIEGSYLSVKTTALVSSVVSVLTLVTFVWMPESPYQLVMKGKLKDAKKSLQILRGRNDVEDEFSRVSEAVIAQMQDTGKCFDLFTTKSNRNALYVSIGLRGFQQLSGVAAIIFYTQDIFREAGKNISSKVITILYYSVQSVLVVLCSCIVDKFGRRPLLMVSMSGSTLALFLEGTYFFIKTQTSIDVAPCSYLPAIFLIGFIMFFSFGMEAIPFMMLGELFPANVKAFALCVTDIFFCVVAITVSKFFQIVKDSFGMYVPFYAFAGCSLLGLVFMALLVPETKGKSLEEIQVYFGGKIRVEREDQRSERVY